MIELDVKKLTSCNSDWELNQYTFLSKIKDWETNFRKNKLYPSLAESTRLDTKLQEILNENLESKWWLERKFKSKLLSNRYVVLEKAQQIGTQLNLLLDFVEWALKLNRSIMEEGLIIKNFVGENIEIASLNADRNYRGKGYFTLPDNTKSLLNIYLFDIKWEWSDSEPEENITTKLVRAIPEHLIDTDIKTLMNEFIKYSQPLYRPVVYIMETDLDFPYKETIFPVTVDKLLKTIME